MSTVPLILMSYRSPNKAFVVKLSEGVTETKIFIWLFVSCFLSFLARLPLLSREVHLDIDSPPLDSMIGGILVSSLFMAPLFFYALSVILCLIFRFWFKGLKWFYFRSAFFWSLLAISPLVLIRGALVGITGANPYITFISISVFLYLIFLLVSSVTTITKVMDVS